MAEKDPRVHIARLRHLVGIWRGQTSVAPTAMLPEGASASTVMRLSVRLGGHCLLVEQTRLLIDPRGSTRSIQQVTIIGWDPRLDAYVTFAFSSDGQMPEAPGVAEFDAAAATFTIEGDERPMQSRLVWFQVNDHTLSMTRHWLDTDRTWVAVSSTEMARVEGIVTDADAAALLADDELVDLPVGAPLEPFTALIGSWRGHETWAPTRDLPDGLNQIGEFTASLRLGARFGFIEQARISPQLGVTQDLQVYGWDTLARRYAQFRFDSNGFLPTAPTYGDWDNAARALTIDANRPPNPHRTRIQLLDADQLSYRVTQLTNRGWLTVAEGSYSRAQSSRAASTASRQSAG